MIIYHHVVYQIRVRNWETFTHIQSNGSHTDFYQKWIYAIFRCHANEYCFVSTTRLTSTFSATHSIYILLFGGSNDTFGIENIDMDTELVWNKINSTKWNRFCLGHNVQFILFRMDIECWSIHHSIATFDAVEDISLLICVATKGAFITGRSVIPLNSTRANRPESWSLRLLILKNNKPIVDCIASDHRFKIQFNAFCLSFISSNKTSKLKAVLRRDFMVWLWRIHFV